MANKNAPDCLSSTPPPPAGWPAMTLPQIEARLCAPGSRFELETLTIGGQALPCWKHMHRTLPDLATTSATQFGERTFLIFEEDRITYRAWFNAVARLAKHMVRIGVRKGDRVALAMRNFPEWPVVFFAAVSAGAIVVPLNAWWKGPELRHGLNQSGTKVLFCDSERWQLVQAERRHLPGLEHIYVCRADEPGNNGGAKLDDDAIQLEHVLGRAGDYGRLPDAALPDVSIGPDDDATILYTSGTTGLPKGALATHRSNLVYIMGTAYSAHRSALRRGEVPADDPPPVLLSPAPLFHVTGLNACLFPLMDAGGTFVLMRKWDTLAAMALIEREKVTKIGGVPTIAWELLEHPARHQFDLGSLQTVFYGGAPSAPELVRRIRVELSASPSNGWGMTEVCAAGTHNSAEDYLHRPESCGPAYPGTALKILDPESHTELLPNRVGELWVKGAQLIKGYWNNPEATEATIKNGWLRTGDLARIDDEGFCFIAGRAKEMIIRGGENIYPVEVENVFFEHPAVVDVAVVGIAHRTLGEQPAAAVHLAPGVAITAQELREWVSSRLAAFKVPVKIVVLDEMLPRNANGKIMKSEVRALVEEHG